MLLDVILEQNFLKLKESVYKYMDEISKEMVELIKEEYSELFEAKFDTVSHVRNGKVQRNKKVSKMDGYRMDHGKMVRMSSQEKLKRLRGQKKAAVKRKAKEKLSLNRREISIKKRKAI